MNIALFATRDVGHQVAKFFGENQEPLTCLVLDSGSEQELNSRLINDSGISSRARVFYSNSLCEEETISALRSLNLDLGILAWWPYIIKENLIGIPRLGFLNFHPSYLPYNRGKHPNFWSLVEDVPFGVTLHYVNTGIDSGDIAYQSAIDKSWEDTGATLYLKAQKEIVRLFKDSFAEIKKGNTPRKPQELTQGSFHRGKELEPASQVYLDRSYQARDLLNLVRARTFHPYPAAWFIENGQRYEARIEIKKVEDGSEPR